jgi:hypothetical protein
MGQLAPARLIAKLLSGYLCGTHSGLLSIAGSGRRLRASPELISSAHNALEITGTNGRAIELGRNHRWQPAEQRVLADEIRAALTHPCVHDLVFYGSQARGGRTGFSDVDAILVVADEAANDVSVLRSLRPHVLRAQRAVLSYQPMQHHGFEVATPTLLKAGSEALALPVAALQETCSLNARTVSATLEDRNGRNEGLSRLAEELERTKDWPSHPWDAHRLVAMFELLPTLYLQATGRAVPKWRSFEEARNEFHGRWWPYDVLQDVRQRWPRLHRPNLERAASVARNPWVAVAAWRRAPSRTPVPIDEVLTAGLLDGLRSLAATMKERAS